MAEGHYPKLVGMPLKSDSSDPKDVAEYIEKQAGILQEGGWIDAAANLRKWASELRQKPVEHWNRG